MYIKSVNQTLDNYDALLRQVRHGNFEFPDTDCDTGRATSAGEYSLADKTYEHLVRDLSAKRYLQPTPALRTNVLGFYSDLNAPFYTKRNVKAWNATQMSVERLKSEAAGGNAGPVN
jgi:hypothetical protein